MRRSVVRNPHILESLRVRLRAAMDERNWMAVDLASVARVPLTSVTRLLDGSVKSPGIDTLLSLAQALDVSVSELLGDRVEVSSATPMRSLTEFVSELINRWAALGSGGEVPYISVLVTVGDKKGLLSDIAGAFKNRKVNIHSSFSGRSRAGKAQVIINAAVDDQGKVHLVADSLRETIKGSDVKVLYPQQSSGWTQELAAFLADDPIPEEIVSTSDGVIQ